MYLVIFMYNYNNKNEQLYIWQLYNGPILVKIIRKSISGTKNGPEIALGFFKNINFVLPSKDESETVCQYYGNPVQRAKVLLKFS